MRKNIFTKRLAESKVLISDGATGTNLFSRGLPRGISAEQWVLEKPDKISTLHTDFIKAGANVILSCTFGASKIRLEHAGLKGRFEEINSTAVKLALEASKGSNVLVAGSIGPLGQILKPFGTIEVEEARTAYSEQADVLSKSGVHLILIETQFDINEASCAVQGAMDVCDLPIICSFSFDRGTKTMMGVSPSNFAQEIGKYDVCALGINCGKSLDDNFQALIELSNTTDLPIWFKPNAGLPTIDAEGNPSYNVTPKEMGAYAKKWIVNGAQVIGGCCGTTPEHLQAVSNSSK